MSNVRIKRNGNITYELSLTRITGAQKQQQQQQQQHQH